MFTIWPNLERSATISEHFDIGTEEDSEGDVEIGQCSQWGSPWQALHWFLPRFPPWSAAPCPLMKAPAVLCQKLTHIAELIIFRNDGCPASSRTRVDYILLSHLPRGSWQFWCPMIKDDILNFKIIQLTVIKIRETGIVSTLELLLKVAVRHLKYGFKKILLILILHSKCPFLNKQFSTLLI